MMEYGDMVIFVFFILFIFIFFFKILLPMKDPEPNMCFMQKIKVVGVASQM